MSSLIGLMARRLAVANVGAHKLVLETAQKMAAELYDEVNDDVPNETDERDDKTNAQQS